MEQISQAAVRRLAVAAQGFAARARRARPDDVAATVERLGAVQLDSISTVDRSHRLVIAARAGAMPREDVSGLLRAGRLFEYWSHEACLLPIADYRLSRWRMRSGGHWGSHARALREHVDVVDHVLGRIREEGPLASRDFDGAGRGGMWNWKPAKAVLDALWDRGDLAIAGRRSGFQRLYDLAERVIPADVLAEPEPAEDELLRELAVRAVRARGVLTVSGIVEHHRLPGGVARMAPHVDALVASGELRRLAVDDGGADVLVPGPATGFDPDALLDAPLPGGVLLSPFDNLLWDRAFAERLFGFKHVMEIYKPAPQRVYGYYVLPFLRGDRLVGRADLKADRAAGTLRVLAFHREPRVRASAALDAALDRALTRLAWTLGLPDVARAA